MKILCSTYWYPYFNGDIHATYVHDINRHLLSLDDVSSVVVVTPNYCSSKTREVMDGVFVERFNFNVPDEYSYGKVAQSKKNIFKKINGIISLFTYTVKNFALTIYYSRKYKVDVIHSHWAIPSGFSSLLASKLLRIPIYITMHGGDVYYNKEEGYIYPKLWYIKPFLSYTLKNCTKLTAITDDCKIHALNAGADEKDIEVIENGADLVRFSSENTRYNYLMDELVGNGAKKVVFTCRQLIPRKGIRYLIKAMPFVLEKNPEALLVIAGDGIERAELESLADELGLKGKVFFVGWVPNDKLPGYINMSDVFVIPSLEEGFGIPAAEAMGCKVPVVSSNAGGLVEVVADGVTGLVVEKGDHLVLADAINNLLMNPEKMKQMGAAGRARVEEKFGWDRTARRFYGLFSGHESAGS